MTKLRHYEVTETMVYEVWARSEAHAEQIIVDDANRDARGPAFIDRYATHDPRLLLNGDEEVREEEVTPE